MTQVVDHWKRARELLKEARDKPLPEDAECHCCMYPHPKLEWYENSRTSGDPAYSEESWLMLLCPFCAMTHASTAHVYPHHVADAMVLQTLAYSTNLLLARLEAIETRLEADDDEA